MENKAAKTAWGPIFQVALEQLIPQERCVIHDAVAYQLMPAYLQALVNLCRIGFVRKTLLNSMDHAVPGTRGGILCRKRYVTDKLNDALSAGLQTVVILGAGFDTLAYRVTAQVVLQQAGYSHAQPAFFIWEGVTQYIPERAVRRVFEFFKKAPLGSQLVFTYIRKDFIDGSRLYGLKLIYQQTRVAKQLWQFGLDPAAIGAFLGQYGWEELEQVGSAEYQQRYLEPVNRTQLVMEIERAVYAQKQDSLPPLRDPPVVRPPQPLV